MSVPGAFEVFESFEPAVNREEAPEYGPLPPAYSLYPLRSQKITVWEAAAPIVTVSFLFTRSVRYLAHRISSLV